MLQRLRSVCPGSICVGLALLMPGALAAAGPYSADNPPAPVNPKGPSGPGSRPTDPDRSGQSGFGVGDGSFGDPRGSDGLTGGPIGPAPAGPIDQVPPAPSKPIIP